MTQVPTLRDALGELAERRYGRRRRALRWSGVLIVPACAAAAAAVLWLGPSASTPEVPAASPTPQRQLVPAPVATTTPAPLAADTTQLVGMSPLESSGAVRRELSQTLQRGQCYADISPRPGMYACTFGHSIAKTCWAMPRQPKRFACWYSPFANEVDVVEVDDTPKTPNGRAGERSSWAVRLPDGRECVSLSGAADMAGDLPVRFQCSGTLVLIGEIDRSRPRWRVRTARYDSADGYARGPWTDIAVSYYARP